MDNLTATVTWIYEDGENAPLSEQNVRLEALRAVGNPIKKRHQFRTEFPSYVTLY